jgi:ATP-dependent RNA helicase DDX46/PRP5
LTRDSFVFTFCSLNGKEKRKSRERSRSRERNYNDKPREKEREYRSERQAPREPPPKEVKEVIEIKDEPSFDVAKFDKEEEQRRLELEMIKRKERIERWRAERKKKDSEIQKKPAVDVTVKKWSLEDDEEDDVEPVTDPKVIEIEDSPTRVKDEPTEAGDGSQQPVKKEEEEEEMEVETAPPPKMEAKDSSPEPEKKEKPMEVEEEDDDVDPLDAFMKGIDNEVRKINKMSKPISSSKSSGIVIVTGNVKNKPQIENKKGELIEQNQDGLEYSSEEEQEDIKDTAANLANKQKKELAKVDHSTVEYSSFKKSFYVEVPEIARMTNEEIDAYRSELEGIQVKGKGCPRPIKTWAQCGVSKKEMDTLSRLDWNRQNRIR